MNWNEPDLSALLDELKLDSQLLELSVPAEQSRYRRTLKDLPGFDLLPRTLEGFYLFLREALYLAERHATTGGALLEMPINFWHSDGERRDSVRVLKANFPENVQRYLAPMTVLRRGSPEPPHPGQPQEELLYGAHCAAAFLLVWEIELLRVILVSRNIPETAELLEACSNVQHFLDLNYEVDPDQFRDRINSVIDALDLLPSDLLPATRESLLPPLARLSRVYAVFCAVTLAGDLLSA